MSKFVFNLQKYLDIKTQLEEQKRLEYNFLLAELEKSKLKRKDLVNNMDFQLASFKKNINYKINGNNFKSYNDYIELLKKKIAIQEDIIVSNEKKAENKRLQLLEAVKQTKMMNTLKENSFIEFLNEQKVQEQKDIDEIVSYRYNNR